jgi:hypothetical protein
MCAALGIVLMRPLPAYADEIVPLLPAAPSQPQRFELTIHGSPRNVFVELYAAGARIGLDQPVDRCRTPCKALLGDGRYELFVRSTSSTFEATRPLGVHESSVIRVEPPSKTERIGGILTAAAGAALIVYSAYTLAPRGCETANFSDCSDHSLIVPFVLGIVGLVAFPVGLILFADSFRFPVDTVSGWAQSSGCPQGCFRTSRGLGFRVGSSF